MISVASFSVRQLRLAIVMLVLALAATTTLTIVYATSGGADQSTGQTGVPGGSNSPDYNDFPGSSNTHGCFRPGAVTGPMPC